MAQLDKCGLGHNVFTQEAIALITRSSEGILRRIRNLALSSLLEAVWTRTKSIGIEIVNKVLIQPYWRNEYDMFTENNAVEVICQIIDQKLFCIIREHHPIYQQKAPGNYG